MSSSVENKSSNDYGNDGFLSSTAKILEKIVLVSSRIFCWAYPILIFAILANVVLRYGFNNGLIVFEEIQWHLYAIGMLFGLSYAEITNSQVRVDVLAANLKKRTILKWEIFGATVFVLPFLFVVIFNSFDYVMSSYSVGETSNSPLGLPYRWAIKAVIPASFIMLGLAVLSHLFRNINILMSTKKG